MGSYAVRRGLFAVRVLSCACCRHAAVGWANAREEFEKLARQFDARAAPLCLTTIASHVRPLDLLRRSPRHTSTEISLRLGTRARLLSGQSRFPPRTARERARGLRRRRHGRRSALGTHQHTHTSPTRASWVPSPAPRRARSAALLSDPSTTYSSAPPPLRGQPPAPQQLGAAAAAATDLERARLRLTQPRRPPEKGPPGRPSP